MTSKETKMDKFMRKLQDWIGNETPKAEEVKALAWAFAMDPELKEEFEKMVLDARSEMADE